MKKVLVGLSGGVDSSVSIALLKKNGFEVVGAYIRGWYPDWKDCFWQESRRDAMRVCAKLGVPFITVNLENEYKKEVVDYFLSEYKNGRTPNPDVMCNKHIKFGAFFDYALKNKFDFVATGHYARIKEGGLLRGKDSNKDQSYFLWSLKKEQLDKIIFPIGDLTKDRVRKLAKSFKLPTSQKKDSQGICFLEDISMEEFLKHYFPEKTGRVLSEDGQEIGNHDGAILYTIGQRHGFKINPKKSNESSHFVISKDLKANTITVSTQKPKVGLGKQLELEEENWLSGIDGGQYEIQTRYRQKPIKADVLDGKISLLEEGEQPAPGQSVVVYKREKLVGGAIIARVV